MKTSAWFLLASSLVINAVLIAAVMAKRTAHGSPSAKSAEEAPGLATAKSDQVKASDRKLASATAATSALENPAAPTKSWWEILGSRDPATFAANLRAAGFAVGSVRGAIYALLRDLQTPERVKAVDLITNTTFWKSGVAPESSATYSKEIARLWLERDRVMRSIFPEEQLAFTLRMQTRFGTISPEKMEKISALEQDYSEMQTQLRAQSRTGGFQMPWSGEQLAFLEQEKIKDLKALLSPQEMEHYQMRGSQLGATLQRQLDGFEPTEYEYREIYRQRALVDEANRAGGQLYSMTPEGSRAQQALQANLKSTLGEARYAEYERGLDYAYQHALRVSRSRELPASTAVAVYELQRGTKQREAEIRAATAQDAAHRDAQLAALTAENKSKLATLLTPAGAEEYTKGLGSGVLFIGGR